MGLTNLLQLTTLIFPCVFFVLKDAKKLENLTKLTKSEPGQNPNDFVLFDEPYTIRKKIPCHVSMSSPDSKMPPAAILEKGANAIRSYWNGKNLRKRSK